VSAIVCAVIVAKLGNQPQNCACIQATRPARADEAIEKGQFCSCILLHLRGR
jgi:hypothetical protein